MFLSAVLKPVSSLSLGSQIIMSVSQSQHECKRGSFGGGGAANHARRTDGTSAMYRGQVARLNHRQDKGEMHNTPDSNELLFIVPALRGL